MPRALRDKRDMNTAIAGQALIFSFTRQRHATSRAISFRHTPSRVFDTHCRRIASACHYAHARSCHAATPYHASTLMGLRSRMPPPELLSAAPKRGCGRHFSYFRCWPGRRLTRARRLLFTPPVAARRRADIALQILLRDTQPPAKIFTRHAPRILRYGLLLSCCHACLPGPSSHTTRLPSSRCHAIMQDDFHAVDFR